MKINKLFILLILIPFIVSAKECDSNQITIEEININDKSENVQEITPLSITNNVINVNIKMSEEGDYIEYKLQINNATEDDYEINDTSSNGNSDYIKYTLKTNDDNIIKAGQNKEVILKIEYTNEIPTTLYEGSNMYNNNQSIQIALLNNLEPNPFTSTGNVLLIIIIAIVSLFVLIVLLKLKKYILIITILLIIPITAKALCSISVNLNSQIILENKKTCHFDGELVIGAEYINGQYTYRYMQQLNNSVEWENITTEGWGMKLTNFNSTDPVTSKMCITINEKPIVSLRATFANSKATSIDVSSFDTSNVKNMRSTFIETKAKEIKGLTSFDTTNVTTMTMMFRGAGATSLDLSSFNTENVKSMASMFQNVRVQELDINHFNTSKVTDMQQLFHGVDFTEIDLTNWDFTNVTNVKSIFRESKLTKVYVSSQEAKTTLDNSSFKPSTVEVIVIS